MKKNFMEAISLNIRKKFMASRLKTFLITAILVVGFFTLNLWIDTIDLPKFDITEKKIFTLSDESKKPIKKVKQDVNIIVYGYDEHSTLVDLLKQYHKTNSVINYTIITDDENPDLVKKYNLTKDQPVVIVESGDLSKTLTSYDFSSYDYTTYQQIDLTENAITNAILNLTIAEKPKIYFLTGHEELSLEQYLSTILSYLQNEVFDYESLNLLTQNTIPEECSLIAIIAPQKDLIEQEVNLLKDYVNRGGNIIFTSDLLNPENANMPNWQSILDLYGLTVENGIIYETNENSYVANSPLIFFPQIESNSITSEISTDGSIIMEMAKRIKKVDEDKQKELNVTYEDLLKSSDKSYFITDFSENALNSIASQTPESSIIALKATKELSDNSNSQEDASNEESTENSDEAQTKSSEIIVIANSTFISNVQSSVASNYSQVNLYNNADFFLNSVANLTNREDTITVRKEASSSTYAPTNTENNIVLIVIFVVPLLIIIIGISVWNHRKRKR